MIKIASYVKARFAERSTWAAISAAVIGGAALAAPYSWLMIGAGVLGAIVPTGNN